MNTFITLLKALLPLVERLLIYFKGVKDGRINMELEAKTETLEQVAKAKRIRESGLTANDIDKLRMYERDSD